MFYLTQFQHKEKCNHSNKKNETSVTKEQVKRYLWMPTFLLIGICELCQGPKWWWPLKGPVITQKPDSRGRGCPHVFFTRWESERKLCVKSPVHTGEWTEGRAPRLPLHGVKCSGRNSRAFLWKETNWILYWHYSMQCNSMQRELTIPLQGQCLCSLCLVWLSRENDLKLVHYLIQMWSSGMEPSRLWVWIHTFCSCVFSLGWQPQSIR